VGHLNIPRDHLAFCQECPTKTLPAKTDHLTARQRLRSRPRCPSRCIRTGRTRACSPSRGESPQWFGDGDGDAGKSQDIRPYHRSARGWRGWRVRQHDRRGREVETTRESILDELEDARQIAREAKNGSAMAMATLGKAKVCGLIIDRREVGDAGAFDNMTDEELVLEAKKRGRGARAFPRSQLNCLPYDG
jgi:hypothetical protein